MLRHALSKPNTETKPSKKVSKKKKSLHDTPLGSKRDKGTEETALEKNVLGAEEEILTSLVKSKSKRQKLEDNDESIKPKAAWEDEDDDNVRVQVENTAVNMKGKKLKPKKLTGEQYKSTLRNEFERISGTPTWARLRWERAEKSSDEDSDTEDLLKKTGNYLTDSESLAQGTIQLKQCTDANKEQYSEGKIKSVQFHTTSQVLLTAGMDHRLHLFQVDGKTNPKIQSIFLENFPIFSAQFSVDGREVIMGSRHKSFYYYDMIAGKVVNVPKLVGFEQENTKHLHISPDGRFIVFRGKHGHIHLVSAKSKELVDTLKMNGAVEALTFTKDGSKLLSTGDDGEVYVWDMNSRACIHRFYDDGCIQGTALATSHNGQYIAVGSNTGVVNIYDNSCLQSKTPKPLKAVMNLTTSCTNMVFNSNTEMLAISSDVEERSVKLVHLPSFTVFSNFPEKTDNLRVPYCMDFSPRGGYFSIGNHKGQALLYRVKHYDNY